MDRILAMASMVISYWIDFAIITVGYLVYCWSVI